MFTTEEREQLREALIKHARQDRRITGAALTGSAALGNEDRWSDIDLAFGIAATANMEQTIADWTELMYRSSGAVHHLDVASGTWIYRVFFLANTLQVDLAFAPASDFGALAPSFELIFGEAVELAQPPARDAAHFIGWGWLYALHARSSVARSRLWQAEFMIAGARNQVLALACLRRGLPTAEARGVDQLPVEITGPLSASLVRSLDANELLRAFRVVIDGLLGEIREVDVEIANRLAGPLKALADVR